MLGALLLAIIGVPMLLLLRTWAREAQDSSLVRQLIDLAVQDQAAAMRLLRDHPELLQARYVHDETPLHFCAVEGFTEGVRFLAGAGMPIDARNEFGDTALVDAVALGRQDVVKVLLSHGADPNAASRALGPVLHVAVSQGRADVAGALLDAGARADYLTDMGTGIWDAVPGEGPDRAAVLKVLERHRVVR